MRRCISTDTYNGQRMYFRMDYIRQQTVYGFFYKYDWQLREWIMFASIAVAKSRQNMWIFVCDDFFTNPNTQFIKSFYM